MTSAVLTRPAVDQADRSGCTATVHDTRWARQVHGCICPAALADTQCYYRDLRGAGQIRRLVPAIGIKRRIWSMWANGHNSATIGAAAGLTELQVKKLARKTQQNVRRGPADAIRAAFILLAGETDDSTDGRRRAAVAKASGYVPARMWRDIDDPAEDPAEEPNDEAADERFHPECAAIQVDEVVIEQALKGYRDPTALARGIERTTFAVAFLMRPGGTVTALARVLKCNGGYAGAYEGWASAVRELLAAKGIRHAWWWELPEVAEAVTVERDRRRLARWVLVTATARFAADAPAPLLAPLLREAGKDWRRWPYRAALIPTDVAGQATPVG